MGDDIKSFLVISIPTMLMFGMRHALDVDHITAIDNLVRLHNAKKRARYVGTGFSMGHLISVLAEMLLIIYVIGNATGSKVDVLSLWGGVIGAISLASIGAINIYSMKKWGKTGSAIFAGKVSTRTGILGPFGSSLVTGIVFGLGFDTATQISAITLSAVASAALGAQVALILAGFFAMGMIPIDTLDSVILRSAFHKIFDKKGFRYMSYALSGAAVTIAVLASYGIITSSQILPPLIGPVLAIVIIGTSFIYGITTRNRRKTLNGNRGEEEKRQQNELQDSHHKQTTVNINQDSDNYNLNPSKEYRKIKKIYRNKTLY
jgi:high-affinity nickel-transport protein